MNKEKKYVWVVTKLYHNENNPNTDRMLQSFFSSQEKAQVNIDWAKSCAINNGVKDMVVTDKLIKYNIQNSNEVCYIKLTKEMIDADDILFGVA